MKSKRFAFVAAALILIVARLPTGQIGQAQDLVQARAYAYFGGGPRTLEADALFENLSDGDTENDPYIISLRSAEDYAKGHIPGAVNMNVKEMFSYEDLATIPSDRDVVVVCYTGQTAAQATTALNMLGYEAYSLLYGMSAWTGDSHVFVKRFNPESDANDYFVELEASDSVGSFEVPVPPAPDLAGAAAAYFGEGPRTLQATDLFENLSDGDMENNPYIISLRSAEDYAKGHIPGAVNMSVKEMFSAEALATIPPDREVVVVCYTGQTAAQATAALNMLGYQAYSLLHGMSSWSGDPEVFVKRFNPETHTNDYIIEIVANEPGGPYDLPFSVSGAEEPGAESAVEPGADPAALETPAQSCVFCHTNKRILEAMAVDEEEIESDQSSGEG